MSIEVEAADVIRIIEQFLQENKLERSLAALQEESGVSLSSLEDKDKFSLLIRKGEWDVVLSQLAPLRLAPVKLVDLYEQIIIELLEIGEIGAARALLRETEPMTYLKSIEPNRYLALEEKLANVHHGLAKNQDHPLHEDSRQKIAESLLAEMPIIPKSRLVTLIGDALRFQQRNGKLPESENVNSFDLLRNIVPIDMAPEDRLPGTPYRAIQRELGAHIECCAFSPATGPAIPYFAVGTADGFIEIWNYISGALRTDLAYQKEHTSMMVMETAILCLQFSQDGELLASGAHGGDISIWKVSTGQCVRYIPGVHPGGVTAVRFSQGANMVISSGYDSTAKIHGMRSGNLVKEFRGHSASVNDVHYLLDESRAMTASSDGTIKTWDVKTSACINTLSPKTSQALVTSPIKSLTSVGHGTDSFLVCSQSPQLFLLLAKGQFVKSYDAKVSEPMRDFIACAVSAQGRYIYAVDEDHRLCCFNRQSGFLESSIKVLPHLLDTLSFMQVAESELIGMAAHPSANVMVTFEVSGAIRFWRA